MAEITLRHDIDTDEETYWWKVVFDESFNKKMYEGALKFPKWQLLEMNDGPDVLTRRVQVEPPVGDLPGPVKKVIGDRLSYIEEGTFDKKTKRYRIKVTPSTLTDKTKINGEMWCEPREGNKVTRICRMSVEVKVFMVGGLVEDKIVADLRASYEQGTTFTNSYVREHGF
jgi:Protein of unknown function (DUF2505)